MKLFCPPWIFTTCVALTVKDFLRTEVDVDSIASKKYGDELSKKYKPIDGIEIASAAKEILFLLDEIGAGQEAESFVDGFIYNVISFNNGKSRNRNPLFGCIFDGEKDRLYGAKETLKMFKSYVFSLRSNLSSLSPVGWTLSKEENIDFIKDIAQAEFSIFDAVS